MDGDRLQRWTRGLGLGICVALSITVGRVVQLKLAPSDSLRPAMGGRHTSQTELATRGQILDRRGRVLATNIVGYRLFADPAWIWQQGWSKAQEAAERTGVDLPADFDPFTAAAAQIGPLMGAQPAAIEQSLRQRADSRYIILDRDLDDWQVDGLRSAEVVGLGVEPKLLRIYPQGDVGARIIGKVGGEEKGLSGAELSYQKELASVNGNLTFLRDVRRRPLHIDEEGYRPASDGDDVRLTIDLVIQEIAERVLNEAVRHWNAGGGRVVVLDPATGDLLAMADVLRSRSGWREVTDDPMRRLDAALGRNRCVTDPYEPGSTFKPFVWAAATELGKARPDSTIPTPRSGPHRTSKGRAIRDVKYYGPVSWRTVLVKSLNAGMAIVAERMSQEEMQRTVQAFGFGQPTHCGVPGESIGLITAPAGWSHFTQTSVAMGHEIGVTPVQMAGAFAAFCGDGSIVQPRLRGAILPDGRPAPAITHRAISEAVSLMTREAMADVVTEGTGRKAQSTLYRMFGKSGTAQLPKPKGQGSGYFEDRYVSSFIAGAPLVNPRLVVLCVIDDPDKSKGHFGGSIAGPVVRDVLDESLQYLGVKPDQDESRAGEIERLARSGGH